VSRVMTFDKPVRHDGVRGVPVDALAIGDNGERMVVVMSKAGANYIAALEPQAARILIGEMQKVLAHLERRTGNGRMD
jgi:hypothetical protein